MKPITDVLRDIRRGSCVAEATEELQKLVSEVRATGKSGKLTIELSVQKLSPNSKAVIVRDKIKVTGPNVQTETVFFADSGGNLTTNDPDQPQLDLRDVSKVTTDAPREVPQPQAPRVVGA